jgi:hypothetical protein
MSKNEDTFTAREFQYFSDRADEEQGDSAVRSGKTYKAMVQFGWSKKKAEMASRKYIQEWIKIDKLIE